MSILDLHSEATIAAAPLQVRPPPAPPPKFSAWSLLTAIPRGVVEAGAQVSASTLELLEPFGATLGRMDGETPEPGFGRKMAEDVRTGVAAAMAPDAQTAHAAEQTLYGFARGASKVMLGAATAGPGGVLLAGAEEGLTATRDLQRQGVDDETALKAGAVQGAGLALAALPLAGRTLAQTAGLYLAGGPGGFVAQQALTREILRQGGYDRIAEGYDPFDPVGLAVSALIPAVFTAAAVRGQRRAAVVSREAEDAARVLLQVEQRDASNPAPDVPRASDAHETALARAEDQVARGDAVEVSDVAPVRAMVDDAAVAERRATVHLLDTQIAQAESELQATLPASADLAERGAIREARAELRQMEQTRVDTSETAIRAAAKEIQAREQVSYKAALSQARKDVAAADQNWQARQDRLNEFIARNAEAQKQTQRVGELEQQLEVLRGRRADEAAKLDAMTAQPLQDLQKAVDDLRTAIDETRGREPGPPREPDQPADQSEPRGQTSEQAPKDQAAQARTTGGAAAQPAPAEAGAATRPVPENPAGAGADAAAPAAPTAGAEKGAAAATPGASAEQGAAAGRLAQIRQQFPDLRVQLDGMDAPMRLDDFLAAVKAEADELGADAPLMQVAAECALLNGAG